MEGIYICVVRDSRHRGIMHVWHGSAHVRRVLVLSNKLRLATLKVTELRGQFSQMSMFNLWHSHMGSTVGVMCVCVCLRMRRQRLCTGLCKQRQGLASKLAG